MVAPNNKKTYGSDPGLVGVSLAEGRKQIVPGNIEILNPEEEGKRACLYLAWIIDPAHTENPEGFQDCVEGRGLCHPFGWFTDFQDLYKLGCHNTPMPRALRGGHQRLHGDARRSTRRSRARAAPRHLVDLRLDDLRLHGPRGARGHRPLRHRDQGGYT